MLAQRERSTPAAADERLTHAWLRRLRLSNFRNYAHLDLAFDRRPVVLVGDNGAGKTNLLEALSLLGPGRGLRRARLAELDRQDAGIWRVAAMIETATGGYDVVMWHDPAAERRGADLDGRPLRRAGDLANRFGVIWLTPAHDRLFVDGPGGRRRFLDRLVLALDPGHSARVNAFERLMRERGTLLTEGCRDADWLRALERQMSELAIAIAAARRALVVALSRILAARPGPFARPVLRLAGGLETALERMSALAAEDWLAALLERSRGHDQRSGGAPHGPHRSDLEVLDGDTGMAARECSTGQQKWLLLAIVLGEARLRLEQQGELPLLLLDEVAAHLDHKRREALLADLMQSGAQVWLTGTDARIFASLGRQAQHFDVNDGLLSAR